MTAPVSRFPLQERRLRDHRSTVEAVPIFNSNSMASFWSITSSRSSPPPSQSLAESRDGVDSRRDPLDHKVARLVRLTGVANAGGLIEALICAPQPQPWRDRSRGPRWTSCSLGARIRSKRKHHAKQTDRQHKTRKAPTHRSPKFGQ